MKASEKAVELLRATEVELRSIMQAALAEARYDDLAAVAPLAAGLSELLNRKDSTTSGDAEFESRIPAVIDSSTGAPPLTFSAAPTATKARRVVGKGDDYPKFEQDDDKLVKIGWSKKDRQEYEHRTPLVAVFRVAEILRAKVAAEKVFSMDKLIPFAAESGEEIPTYQAYLAMAWFRSIGAVEQCGKEGYRLSANGIDQGSLERAYNSLPKH